MICFFYSSNDIFNIFINKILASFNTSTEIKLKEHSFFNIFIKTFNDLTIRNPRIEMRWLLLLYVFHYIENIILKGKIHNKAFHHIIKLMS